MKNYKPLLAIILAAVMTASFAACQKPAEDETTELQTEIVVVTDKNGETVTNDNGEVVTEIVTVNKDVTSNGGDSKAEDSKPNTTEKEKKDSQDNKGSKDDKDNKNGGNDSKDNDGATNNETVTKMAKPKNVSGLKAEPDVHKIKFTWNKVDCSGYELAMSKDGKTWETLEQLYQKESYKLKDLNSSTKYYFRVRAINANTAGRSPSDWALIESATTVNEDPRNILVNVLLPVDSNKEDTLVVTVTYKDEDGEKQKDTYSFTVHCDGKPYSFITGEEYTGTVKVKAKLKEQDLEHSRKTDSEEVTLDVSVNGTIILDGGED